MAALPTGTSIFISFKPEPGTDVLTTLGVIRQVTEGLPDSTVLIPEFLENFELDGIRIEAP